MISFSPFFPSLSYLNIFRKLDDEFEVVDLLSSDGSIDMSVELVEAAVRMRVARDYLSEAVLSDFLAGTAESGSRYC